MTHQLDEILSELEDLSFILVYANSLSLIFADKANFKMAVNATSIKQIVGNLVSNVLVFIPGKGVVKKHLKKIVHVILIIVQDSEIGMSADVLDSIQNMEKAVLCKGIV